MIDGINGQTAIRFFQKNNKKSLEERTRLIKRYFTGLSNASGQLMHEDTLRANVLKYKTKLNLPSGVYMMQLKGKNIDSLHKIVIK